MNNLIDQKPEQARQMISLYEKWARENKILPWIEVRQILKEKWEARRKASGS